ncbi:MAG: hypothetical protein QGI13_01355 [Rhodospirillales bacterium]|jgi:ABC-type Fe3+ transport system permease subunit|nr:hypothetical protein [Rhodospirillales bacterium]
MADRHRDSTEADQQIKVARLTWTLILVCIGSVLVWGCGLLLIFLGEQALETAGIIPRLWGANNMTSIVIVSTLFSVPFIFLLIIGLFRQTNKMTEVEAEIRSSANANSTPAGAPSRGDEPAP